MLKARWHLGYLARVPVLPPHQLQLLWLPYVPKEKQDTRWMSIMSWLKRMLVFAWGTAEFSHWWHGMLAIMEHKGKRKNQSFYISGMKLHNVTSSWGEVSQISTVQLPTFLDLWNTGESYGGKGPPLLSHHFRVTSAAGEEKGSGSPTRHRFKGKSWEQKDENFQSRVRKKW